MTSKFAAPGMSDRWKARALTLAIIACVLAFMQAVTSLGIVSTFLLPSPIQIASSLPELIREEDLLGRLRITAIEVFVAASLAIMIGSLAGWGLHRSQNAWLAFTGWIAGLNATPLVLLAPMLLVVFGRGGQTIVAIGVLGGLPPIMLKMREGFSGVPQVLRNVAQSFNLTRAGQFWLVELPSAIPTLVAGVRLGSFYTLHAVIGAEFLTGVGGVGALIPDLGERFQIARMYGTIVFVILASALFIGIIKRFERWVRPK